METSDVFQSLRYASAGTSGAPMSAPRICMPTWRNFAHKAFRCALYEAQDVLREIDDVDMIPLDLTWAARVPEAWLRNPLYHDVTRKIMFANLGLKKVRLRRKYDLFVAVCNTYWDLPYINAIDNWREHCKVSVCWIDEMWAAAIAGYKHWLHALKQFDYVFMGCHGSVGALARAANRPCYWLPAGIDTLRFSAFPHPPARVIDVYSIGRRHEGVHLELLRESLRDRLFYVHDSLGAANANVYDYRQHRQMYANFARRSRYFLVASAKMNANYETHGQIEIGHRYFEGAAAGAIMVGEAPNCDAYRQLFDWPDAVVTIQPDGSDTMAVLNDLSADQERSADIRMRNSRESLLRHDWGYRWTEMFRVAGVDPPRRWPARQKRLGDLADQITGMRAVTTH